MAQLEQQQQTLVEQERRLSAKVEAFRTQKEVMKAQYSAAEAQVRIGEATTGLGEEMSDVGLAIQRAQDKTEQMQARAAAVDELVATGAIEDLTAPAGSDIDRQLTEMSASTQVESELAKLRAEIGPASGGERQLSAGAEPSKEAER